MTQPNVCTCQPDPRDSMRCPVHAVFPLERSDEDYAGHLLDTLRARVRELEAELGLAQASLTMLRDDVAWLRPAVIAWRVKAGRYRKERNAARSALKDSFDKAYDLACLLTVERPSLGGASPHRFNDTGREIL